MGSNGRVLSALVHHLGLSLLLLKGLFFVPSGGDRAPSLFIFGDSLVDNGNNNYLSSTAKANYEPYGIDFGMPTGRFCNGLTATDYGARMLGLPFPPPYLSLESATADILRGANYASASAGILDETGRNYGSRITFNGQIGLFERTVKLQLPVLVPDAKALTRHLASSVFIIIIGSNDYINNYLLPDLYSSSRTYSGEGFADLLINTYTQQLKSLYSLGARKMVLVGVGPLGCIPSQLSLVKGTGGGCIERINSLVSAFNSRLLPLTTTLRSTLPGSFFVYQNIYDTVNDMIQNPTSYGFIVVNQACCGNRRYGGALSCLPLESPCSARDWYVFWDSFHPTQAANAIIAGRCYNASASERDCYPISIYRLAQM